MLETVYSSSTKSKIRINIVVHHAMLDAGQVFHSCVNTMLSAILYFSHIHYQPIGCWYTIILCTS